MDYARARLADALAAQYVAGTLRSRARRRFEALLPGHPALQQAVREWELRLMPLTEVLPDVAPPADVWSRIEARLWPATVTPTVAWWQRLGLWRAIVASFSGDGHALVTRTLTPVVLAPQRSLQLWAVPEAGAPRPLGLISANGSTVLRRDQLPPALLAGGTAALAVSIEPPGGSPTGAPTGPVVFAGKLQR